MSPIYTISDVQESYTIDLRQVAFIALPIQRIYFGGSFIFVTSPDVFSAFLSAYNTFNGL